MGTVHNCLKCPDMQTAEVERRLVVLCAPPGQLRRVLASYRRGVHLEFERVDADAECHRQEAE